MFGFRANRFSRRQWSAVGCASVILVVGLAIGGSVLWSKRQDSGEPQRGSEQSPAKALEADPSLGSIEVVASASEYGTTVTTESVEIRVDAPPGATEMQVGIDPTFTSTAWQEIKPTQTLTIRRSGYQSVFARFRTAPEAPPSAPVVVGVTIDPTYTQATSGGEDEKKEPSWVRALSPRAVSVRVEDGRLVHGHQEPYDFDSPPPGDEIDTSGKRPSVTRNGEPYGTQVSGTNTVLKTHDRIVGGPIDGALLENAMWTLRAEDGTTLQTVAVDSVANVNGTGRDSNGEVLGPLVHDVFLELEEDLENGVSYRLESDIEGLSRIDYEHQPLATVSPALHVNQLGFTSDSETKVGYVSGHPSGVAAIDYAKYQRFVVVDLESSEEVYSGKTTPRPAGNEVDKGDLTGVTVHEADFSDLDRLGTYAFCLIDIGCSEAFEIRDSVWLEATTEVARAMYHQRSGVALGPPYSSIARPRPYHPDDGVAVHASSYSILDGLEEPLEDIFAGLVREQTDEMVPEAWGGHFDAGDWDRRVQHLWYVRSAAQLVETYPDVFGQLDLNIPESGDGVPDVLDEAMWSLDAYRRMQTEDGGIRGGIEASEHPQARDSSWTDDLAVFAFEPDPWSSYIYAGVAAELSLILEPYDEAKADMYQESALRAMAWAEAQPEHETKNEKVQSQRTVAAAALLKRTGDKKWHDLFVAGTSFDATSREFLSCHGHDICDAAWLYVTADPATTDPDIRKRVVDSFVISADDVVDGTESTSFGWALEDRNIPLVWGLGPGGNPSSVGLMRAFSLTGDEKYRSAAVRSASVTLGANPRNTVYVTGLGANPVQHPLIVDSVNGGLPVWAGTPVFGPHQLNALNDESWVSEYQLKPTGAHPDVDTLPYVWQWQDVSNVAMFNEYTVHQSHAGTLYAFGMLAGSYS